MAYVRKPRPSAASLQTDPGLVRVYRAKLPNGEEKKASTVAKLKERAAGYFRRIHGATGELVAKER